MPKYRVELETTEREVRLNRVHATLSVEAETAEEAGDAVQKLIDSGEIHDVVEDAWEFGKHIDSDEGEITGPVEIALLDLERGPTCEDAVEVDAKEVLRGE